MKRSPLCGRNFEYFSEDPYLAGELGVGIVDGIQSRGVGTSVKHYAANNQETDRLRVDAQVDERTLREIYLPAFERIVTACQPWTIMCSYNKVNGLSASENPWLLTTVLREEFGFAGLVVSDWGAVYHRVPALGRGWTWRCRRTCRAARTRSSRPSGPGSWPSEVLDARVRAVLELVDKGMGVLDLDEEFDADAHHALARAAAAESVVLLKNDGRDPAARADEPDRRDRRVRPDPALPGRGQLAGQPHPGRERPRRAAPRRSREVTFARRVRDRRHRRRRGAARRGRRRSRRPPRPWSC